jgi:hypothetical protein
MKDASEGARRTIVSETIRGMGKGMFRRGPKPNSFGLMRNVNGAEAMT